MMNLFTTLTTIIYSFYSYLLNNIFFKSKMEQTMLDQQKIYSLYKKIFKTDIKIDGEYVKETGFLISKKHIITSSTISRSNIKGKAMFQQENGDTTSFDIKTDGLFIRNEELDFTICELCETFENEERSFINIFENNKKIKNQELIGIGYTKEDKLSCIQFKQTYFDNDFVYYDKSIQSSGSPIFDNKFNIVAIHHGTCIYDFFGFISKPISVGIAIDKIVDSLSNEQIEIIKKFQ